MKAGPKGRGTVPYDRSWLPSGGEGVIAFIESDIYVPTGRGALQPLALLGFQRHIARGLFDDPRPRRGLVSIPAGNGKTTLAAALGLYGLLADGVKGAQVLVVASDQRQARITLDIARRMVELNPELAASVQVFADKLYYPQTDSTFTALPADPGGLQGWNPSLAIVDELHVVTEELYEAMAARAGKRDRSLLLAISTPAADTDGVMWRLVEQGRAGVDPEFFFVEYAAPVGCAIGDEDAWAHANPALDQFLYRDGVRSSLAGMREASFRRYRLGQWPTDIEDAWLPPGAWAACTDTDRTIADGASVVLGFDGSFNGDYTALIACTVETRPHLEVVELWEPPDGARDWQVPILDVEQAIRDACRRYRVREIIADPFRWSRSLQVLEAEGLPVVEFPQSPERMTPATSRLYEAIVNRAVSHSGDARLARHMANAKLRESSRGAQLTKEHKHSRRRIDLAVAAVMAHDRACYLAGVRTPRPMIYV